MSLVISLVAACGIAVVIGGTALLRSYGEGRAAVVALETTQTALDVTRRHGAAALVGAQSSCAARVGALEGHAARLEAWRRQALLEESPEVPPSGDLCEPTQAIRW